MVFVVFVEIFYLIFFFFSKDPDEELEFLIDQQYQDVVRYCLDLVGLSGSFFY